MHKAGRRHAAGFSAPFAVRRHVCATRAPLAGCSSACSRARPSPAAPLGSPAACLQREGGAPAQGAGVRRRRGGPDVCAARRPHAQPWKHHQQVGGCSQHRRLLPLLSRACPACRPAVLQRCRRSGEATRQPLRPPAGPPAAYAAFPPSLACSALQDHFPVIPEPIREYIEEVKLQLEEVTHSPGGCASAWKGIACAGCVSRLADRSGQPRAAAAAAPGGAAPRRPCGASCYGGPSYLLPSTLNTGTLPVPAPPPDLPLEEKSAFLKETRHAFGRTALVLRCVCVCTCVCVCVCAPACMEQAARRQQLDRFVPAAACVPALPV